jgi:hypothetical protein
MIDYIHMYDVYIALYKCSFTTKFQVSYNLLIF